MNNISTTHYGTRETRRRERGQLIASVIATLLVGAFIWFVLVIF